MTLSTLLILVVCRTLSGEALSAKSEDLRFQSSWRLRIFSLYHARDKTKNIFPLKKISSFAKNVETLFSVRDWGNIRNSQNFGKFFLNWGSHLSSATCWQIDNLPAGLKGRSALADKIAIVRDKIQGQILSWQFLSRLLHPHWQG